MRTSHWVAALAGVAAALGLASGAAAGPGNSDEARAEHERIVAYWTPARAAAAIPRDFTVDPATGRVRPMAKPEKPGKPAPDLEDPWEGADGPGTVGATTGKVLFTLGQLNYVCSASVVVDDGTGYSVVVTAAHCAYDWKSREATNWMFIPGFDPGDSFSACGATDYGCWTADSLHVNDAFKEALSFNRTAMTNDFAFAVMGTSTSLGGGNTKAVLDEAVGSQPISFTTATPGTTTTALGYPQGRPYDGTTLYQCHGELGTDEYLGNFDAAPYRIPCGMTGGSSGGPWYSPLGRDGTGAVMSVISYGYTRDIRTTKDYNDSAMSFGPIFNSEATLPLYQAALGAAAALDESTAG